MGRIAGKKRKGFHGKRPAELNRESMNAPATPAENNSPATAAAIANRETSTSGPNETPKSSKPLCLLKEMKNASANKLENSQFVKEINDGMLTRGKAVNLGLTKLPREEPACGLKIQDFKLLGEAFSAAAVCRACKKSKSKIQLVQKNYERAGLAESLALRCPNCDNEIAFSTSQKVSGNKGGRFEVNKRSVYASHSGRAHLAKFCGTMGLQQPVTTAAFNETLKEIEVAAVSEAMACMKDASARLKEVVLNDDLNRAEVDIVDGGKELVNVAVTVDGTWQKRGHTSKVGVVFVASVDTGEVLDFEVLSHICQTCTWHKNHLSVHEFEKWFEKHRDSCEVNHKGSSGDMENKGAILIFGRSIESRGLRYTEFVGDGDSSCFGKVSEAMKNQYGESYTVTKEECVGHIQKRMGTALTEYKKGMKGKKLADEKTVGGAGRLTQEVIKRIQNYYGFAIRKNKGNLEGMQENIKAIQHHVIQNPQETLEEQHRFCPKSEDTWCRFWKDKINNTNDYKEDQRLPTVFMLELEPIFKRLSNDDLLKRCLKGLTQNQNESINSILWSKISKARYCGKRRIMIAACETTCTANTGAATKSSILQRLGITPGRNTISSFRNEDSSRLKSASKKISIKCRMRRKQLKFQKVKKTKERSYKAGAFGVREEPDLIGKKQAKDSLREKSKKRKALAALCNAVAHDADQSMPSITFVDERTVTVHQETKRRKMKNI